MWGRRRSDRQRGFKETSKSPPRLGITYSLLQFRPRASDAQEHAHYGSWLTKRLREIKDVVGMLEAWEAVQMRALSLHGNAL
jgi:hypothetical protein